MLRKKHFFVLFLALLTAAGCGTNTDDFTGASETDFGQNNEVQMHADAANFVVIQTEVPSPTEIIPTATIQIRYKVVTNVPVSTPVPEIPTLVILPTDVSPQLEGSGKPGCDADCTGHGKYCESNYLLAYNRGDIDPVVLNRFGPKPPYYLPNTRPHSEESYYCDLQGHWKPVSEDWSGTVEQARLYEAPA